MKLFKKLTAALLSLALLGSAAPAAAEGVYSPRAGAGAVSGSIPVALVVVGFDGGSFGGVPTPYRDDYDWAGMVFNSEDGISAYYASQSFGSFTFLPARERSAYGVSGNTNPADRADDGVVHVTLRQRHVSLSPAAGFMGEDFVADAALQEALDAAAEQLDFSGYDADGSGTLDASELAVVFVLAGFDSSNELLDLFPAEQYPGWWPISMERASLRAGSVELTRYCAISEQELALAYDTPLVYTVYGDAPVEGTGTELYDALFELSDPAEALRVLDYDPSGIRPGSVATICHELSHYLGTDDYYDTAYTADDLPELPWNYYTPAYLSLMDSGTDAELDDGTLRPTALDPYTLSWLGWIQPETVTASGTYELHSRLSESGYNVLRIDTDNPDEYFLLENRQPEGQDAAFSTYYEGEGGGIVVWHVDEAVMAEYHETNEVNVAAHRPGLTPVYLRYIYEEYGEDDFDYYYTTELTDSYPDIYEPFFHAGRLEAALGIDTLELERYGAGADADDFYAQRGSGIRLRFPTASGRDMKVEILLPEDASEETPPTSPFADVPPGFWAEDAITALSRAGIMNGSDGLFSPSGNLTRAMTAQLFYNLAGGMPGQSVFADVAAADWYAPAVGWAAGQGIIQGWEGFFRPLDNVTRQDLLTILYRYVAALPGFDLNAAGAESGLPDYADLSAISDYAAPAFFWALRAGLVGGYEDGTLRPAAPVTRAEASVILARFLSL